MKADHVINFKSERTCPISVGDGITGRLAGRFEFGDYSSLTLITDSVVDRLYGQDVLSTLKATGKPVHCFQLPAGERAKSLSTVERGFSFLLANNVDRQGLICALGGGVVGDTAGFIAASYLRGIDYIQLPTTLLAQVDSAIGGKVGVNFSGKKNMVGAFYQPRAIIIDIDFLKSLPPNETANGLGEVVKYAVAMDEGLYRILEQKADGNFSAGELTEIVRRCCRLKADIVEIDEKEKTGRRAILNFGHTLAHALEAAQGFKGQGHGQAVAVGIVAAARISRELGMLKTEDANSIERLLKKLGLPAACPGLSPGTLLKAIRFDKKKRQGRTRWVLLEAIGRAVSGQTVDEAVVEKVFKELCR
ncbi:MAG: 3-dehydroquinate synthase [Dehalococcoidia bacterium]|jgi:3-dehydroquinate synthase